jgi:hypothetical protein
VALLSKLQRNALWHALAESGLYLGDFSYVAADDNVMIRHAPSLSHFKISPSPVFPESFSAKWQVGDEPWTLPSPRTSAKGLIAMALAWGVEVSEWIATPDLWDSMPGQSGIPGQVTPESANTPFTPDEQKAIAEQLKAIAESVKQTYDLTAEQTAVLNEKFEEAAKASERVSRKDWGLLVGGTVFSLILADVITPGVAGHILMMIEHGIGHLFAGATPAKHVLSEG